MFGIEEDRTRVRLERNKGRWFDGASRVNQARCRDHVTFVCVFDFVAKVLSVYLNPPRLAKYDQETQHHGPSVCGDQFFRAPIFATETSSILLSPDSVGLSLISETCCEQ